MTGVGHDLVTLLIPLTVMQIRYIYLIAYEWAHLKHLFSGAPCLIPQASYSCKRYALAKKIRP